MDGGTVDEAAIAAEIWDSCKPHAPSVLLAYLFRNNRPFPSTGVPARAPGLNGILAISGWTVERYGPEFLHFRCPACMTNMYEPASELGMAHARNVAMAHNTTKRSHGISDSGHPTCCEQRAAANTETTWPDSLAGTLWLSLWSSMLPIPPSSHPVPRGP